MAKVKGGKFQLINSKSQTDNLIPHGGPAAPHKFVSKYFCKPQPFTILLG